MVKTRNIVVLGASYAGLSATHYILKHVYPTLTTVGEVQYKLLLIDPSTKFYARHASPRAAASAELLPAEKVFLDIQAGLEQYGDKVTFVNAKATSWSPENRELVLEMEGGSEEVLGYYALVLATGTKTSSPLFSLQGTSYKDNEKALDELHRQMSTAKSVVIAGGGPAGIETAAEIGETLNGAPGWFFSAPAPKAKVTVITNSDKLLPVLRPAVAKQAETYLNRLGVDVRYNSRMISAEKLPNGQTSITLQNGEELVADIYIPATGLQPMSDYAPAHLKDSKGYIKTNQSTLRVDEAGPRVYTIGDIGTYSKNSITEILSSAPVLATNLQRDLLAAHQNTDAKPVGEDRLFISDSRATQVVPIGRNYGVGEAFGWRVPSWFVWLLKGRSYMLDKAYQQVDGSMWAKEVAWSSKERLS